MGWTYQTATHTYRNGKINRKAEMDGICTSESGSSRWGIVKSAMVGSTYYAAAYREDKATGKRKVYGLVALTTTCSDLYNFGWKEIEETCGPSAAKCPASILRILEEQAPLDDANDPSRYGREWRRKCREHIEEQENPCAWKNVERGDSIIWFVPKDSHLTCNGVELAGAKLVLTKPESSRIRTWQCYRIGARVSTKYVAPKDCVPIA